MQILIEIPDSEIPKNQELVHLSLHFIDRHICECSYPYMELPKGHGPLIDQYAAIKAVDDRHEYLMRDPIYRKKKGNQIDLIGIKQHIWDIAPIVEKDKEQT